MDWIVQQVSMQNEDSCLVVECIYGRHMGTWAFGMMSLLLLLLLLLLLGH